MRRRVANVSQRKNEREKLRCMPPKDAARDREKRIGLHRFARFSPE
jgi:hypothetical protein